MKISTVAYDLSQFAPEETRRPRVKVVKSARKKSRAKRAFKVKCVLYLATVALLMIGRIYSRQQLTETDREMNAYTQELTDLKSENAYLNYELENYVSLRNAEEYAEENLGLVKLDSNQIEYVSLNSENVIESREEEDETFWDFLNSITEFLFG
jgi:cell division protein FtsL